MTAVTPEEMRELIRQANGAVKDLRAVLRQVEQARAETIRLAREAVDKAIETSANERIERYVAHMQAEQNRHAANLNAAVIAAKKAIVASLATAKIRILPGGEIAFDFNGRKLFNDQETAGRSKL